MQIEGKNITANYHTHTTRCLHAVGEDREYAERAYKSGLKVLGYSDHAPYIFKEAPEDFYSGYRMRPDQYEGYRDSIYGLRKEYSGRLEIHLGLEAEYYPKCFDDFLDHIQKYGCEYLILGQHYTKNEYDGEYAGGATDSEKTLSDYTESVIMGIGTGRFSYVAHPDIIKYTGDQKIYEKYMREICRTAKKAGIPLEINLLGLRMKRQYPNDIFWNIAKDEGNDTVIGFDAHEPQYIDNEDQIRKGIDFASVHGLSPLERVKLVDPFHDRT